MTTDKVTTTDYKYHIYELVNGKWVDANPAITDRAAQERFLKQLRQVNKPPIYTFKLVTEKITTVHEFIEEAQALQHVCPSKTNNPCGSIDCGKI